MLFLVTVGLIQSTESLNTSERPTIPQIKGNSSCLTAFNLKHLFFPAFRLKLTYWLFSGLEIASLGIGTTLFSCFSGFQTQTGTISLVLLYLQLVDSLCRSQDFSASIIVSQFFIVSLSLSLSFSLSYWLCFTGESLWISIIYIFFVFIFIFIFHVSLYWNARVSRARIFMSCLLLHSIFNRIEKKILEIFLAFKI